MRKWAIKKGYRNTLSVWRYIDDEKEARTYWYINQAIDEDGVNKVLPLAMNDVGGYHWLQPDIDAGNVVRIIESDTKPVLSLNEVYEVNSPNFKYGWLSPECVSYSCDVMGHIDLSEKICNEIYNKPYFPRSDDWLLDQGWIKIYHDGWFGHWEFINDEQIEWLEAHNIKCQFDANMTSEHLKEMRDWFIKNRE